MALHSKLGSTLAMLSLASLATSPGMTAEPAVNAMPIGEGALVSSLPTWGVEVPRLGEASAYLPMEQTRVVVRLGKRQVSVYKGEQLVTSYPIAIGKTGWETPTGDFQIVLLEEHPTFKSFKSGRIIPPGPDNPLGARWVGFWSDGKTQLGFHGTNEPELIGQAVSHGCIRMHNKDVTALFNQVQIGTPVKIEP
jgi:hypothetical protein